MSASTLVRVPCPMCGSSTARYERTLNGFSLDKCTACRFVFMNPRQPPLDIRAMYEDKDTERLIELYGRLATPSILEGYERVLDVIDAYAPKRGRLLDLGCAAGYFFERAGRRGWEAHGIDLGEWTVEAARRRGLSNLRVGTLAEQGFLDGWFDVVYAAEMLEHLPDPHEEMKEICRVLRPGGLLYVTVPNYQCLSIVLGKDDFELNAPPQHLNYFIPATLGKLFQTSGLRTLRIASNGGVKWENLLGRRVSSEIAGAYRSSPPAAAVPAREVRAVRLKAWLNPKRFLGPVLKPLLYNWVKVGMSLYGIALKQ